MVPTKARRRPGRPAAGERGPADSRAELLDAAARVFAARGYRAATVDEIVKRARLSKGTFYWHFRSKEDLFLALLEERLDRPVRELMELTRTAPADVPTAGDVSRGLAELLARERDLVLLHHEYWSAAVRNRKLAAKYRERQAAMREALAAALAARHEHTGVPLTMPADSLAEAFIALAYGLSLDGLIDPDAVGAGLFGEMLSLVYDGLVFRARNQSEDR